jgi:hypothetical protein
MDPLVPVSSIEVEPDNSTLYFIVFTDYNNEVWSEGSTGDDCYGKSNVVIARKLLGGCRGALFPEAEST